MAQIDDEKFRYGTIHGQKKFSVVFKAKTRGDYDILELKTRKCSNFKKWPKFFRLLAWFLCITITLAAQESLDLKNINFIILYYIIIWKTRFIYYMTQK